MRFRDDVQINFSINSVERNIYFYFYITLKVSLRLNLAIRKSRFYAGVYFSQKFIYIDVK